MEEISGCVQSPQNEIKGKLRIFFTSKGAVDLETYFTFSLSNMKGAKNGLRKDLAQAL
jgi:hypothetical protein